jgi:RNA polymerase-binding transcription factor DksA
MTAKVVQRAEARLLERRAQVAHMLRDRVLAEQAEQPTDDPDWVDRAVASEDLVLLDHLAEVDRARLTRIDAALERIRRGSYGCCTACGSRIEEVRLRSMPETPYCLSCAVSSTEAR